MEMVENADESEVRVEVELGHPVNVKPQEVVELDGKPKRKQTLEHFTPEEELRRTIRAVSGLMTGYDFKSLRQLMMKLTTLPSIAVFLMFIIPQCSLETQGYDCMPIPVLNWFPSVVLVICLVSSEAEWFNVQILQKRLSEAFGSYEYSFIYGFPVLGVCIVRPLLDYAYGYKVVPVGILWDLLVSFNGCSPPICYFIWKHVQKRNIIWEDAKYVYTHVFWGFVVVSMGPVTILFYKMYTVGYNMMRDSVDADEIPSVCLYLYGSLGIKIVKEICLKIFKTIYNQFDSAAFSNAQMWVFFLHGTEVIALQSLAKDPLEVLMLTFADISGMAKNCLQMYMNEDIRIRAQLMNIQTKTQSQLQKSTEIPEKVALHAMELVLMELVECIIPVLYLMHAVFIWISPNSSNTLGIKRKSFSDPDWSNHDLPQFAQQCVMVIVIEIVSVIMLQQLIQRWLKIHLFSGAAQFINRYVDFIAGCNLAVIILFWATRLTYFGVDLALEFDWLEIE